MSLYKHINMDSFVAIRKQTRTAREGLEGASVKQKLDHIYNDEEPSLKSKLLEEQVGLKRLEPQTDIIERPIKEPFFSRLRYIGAYIVGTEEGVQAKEAKELLEKDYYIVPNISLSLPATVRTEIRGSKRGSYQHWPDYSGISAAHQLGIKGDGVKILVLDTGCDADHIQFEHTRIHYLYIDPRDPRQRRRVRGFDTHGHGTHVCGIIAGRDIGIAPDADLYVASVIESESISTSLERVLYGLDWLMSEVVRPDDNDTTATLLNMSLGFLNNNVDKGYKRLLTKSLRSALRILVEDFNVLPIVASGNDGAGTLRVPGCFPEVLSVGAVDVALNKAGFTSQGPMQFDDDTVRHVPDVWGYGVDVYSSLERNSDNRSKYALKSGTSMAAPYVTGIAALYAQSLNLQGMQLRDHILNSSLDDSGIVRFIQ